MWRVGWMWSSAVPPVPRCTVAGAAVEPVDDRGQPGRRFGGVLIATGAPPLRDRHDAVGSGHCRCGGGAAGPPRPGLVVLDRARPGGLGDAADYPGALA